MHSKTRRCKLHIWLFRGGDACAHNLPLTGIYKVNSAQVLAYERFYKSENFCAYANSALCAYAHFKDEIYAKFYT